MIRLCPLFLCAALAYLLGSLAQTSYAGIVVTDGDKHFGKLPALTLQKLHNPEPETLEATLSGQHRLTLLVPVYTKCPTVCPTLARTVAESYTNLPTSLRKDVQIVVLSFEPKDTREDLASFQTLTELPSEWVYAVGDESGTKTLLNQLDYFYTKNGMQDYIHSGTYYAISPEGLVMGIGSGGFGKMDLEPFLARQRRFSLWLSNPSTLATIGLLGFAASVGLVLFAVRRNDRRRSDAVPSELAIESVSS